MAQIIKTNGEIIETQPSNGTDFSLTELQAVVGGFIEVVHLSDGRLMVVNEEGKLDGLPINEKASELYPDLIVGDVLVCDIKQIK